MKDIQQNILLALYNFFEQNQNKGTGDKEIANSLSVDIDRVRVCLKDLKKKDILNWKMELLSQIQNASLL